MKKGDIVTVIFSWACLLWVLFRRKCSMRKGSQVLVEEIPGFADEGNTDSFHALLLLPDYLV